MSMARGAGSRSAMCVGIYNVNLCMVYCINCVVLVSVGHGLQMRCLNRAGLGPVLSTGLQMHDQTAPFWGLF